MSNETTKRATWAELDGFTRGYIECALWSSMDGSDENTGGDPLDRNYSWGDLDDKTLAQMIEDCRTFQADERENLDECGLSFERQGHNFWLNRNGHGSGFWDEGDAKCFERLSDASEVYGTFDLYVYETASGETVIGSN